MYRARNIQYEHSDRVRGLASGGIGAMHQLAQHTGVVEAIDRHVAVLKVALPYHESDHVLGIAYNVLCGGTCLQDIEQRRQDEVYLDALGTQRIPDPTTAGDFGRRFDEPAIEALQTAINDGNRPSSEGAAERFDQAHALCREAGFQRITFRGDTDFSQTAHVDRWDRSGVRFVFGYDARANVSREADALPARAWTPLVRRPPYAVQTEPRQRPVNVKEATIVEREFKTLRLKAEAVAEFPYQPTACTKAYRMVVVRKNISVERGDQRLFDEIRYFFYLTNDHETAAADLVFLANDRCNQENLIDQLKHGVGATRMPVDTLLSNWAYMVMAALAWTFKAWLALRLPESGRWAARAAAEKAAVLRMEFKAFLHAFILIPVQVVRTSRRLVFRLLAWNPWQAVFLRGVDQLHQPLRS